MIFKTLQHQSPLLSYGSDGHYGGFVSFEALKSKKVLYIERRWNSMNAFARKHALDIENCTQLRGWIATAETIRAIQIGARQHP